MSVAPLPIDEEERLQALHQYGILDTAPEANFDTITELLSELFDMPWVFVSLVDRDRQWFKSHHGSEATQTVRETAFAAHAILQDDPLVVPDATQDSRFSDNPSVVDAPFIRSYAAVPLVAEGGFKLGVLCVVSPQAREYTEREIRVLKVFARLVVDELELKRSMLRLAEKRERVAQAERLASIGSLAAGLAHEINTPMQFVASNTQFLQESFEGLKTVLEAVLHLELPFLKDAHNLWDCEPLHSLLAVHDTAYLLKEVAIAVQQTKEGIARVTELLSALKTFSHPTRGEAHPESVNAAIEVAVTVSRSSWQNCAELHLELAHELPLVTCTLAEFSHVILNLIVNAAQAIEARLERAPEPKGLIILRTLRKHDSVVIEVQDNGCGIPAENLSRIFEPFFTTKAVGKGIGQGLAASYDIVTRKHQGRLDVKSSPEKCFTLFSVSLPIDGPASKLQVAGGG